MKIYFYLTHTLYAKVLIPLIVKLADKNCDVFVSKNKFDFLKYSPRLYGSMPVSNRFVNRNSFDFVAGISDYSGEWNAVKDRVNFTYRAQDCDVIIGTTKNLDKLKILQKKNPNANIYAVGYQHMPFVMSLKGGLKKKNLPPVCMDIFTKPNPFSDMHGFPGYISNHDFSFRGFPYLEKAHEDYYPKHAGKNGAGKKYVLIFHPGGYRDIVSKKGDSKKTCYRKQTEFLRIICGPIFKNGLIPVIKVHPLAARHHFKEDVSEIVNILKLHDRQFRDVIIEDRNYYKYAYESDCIVTFGSSGIYEIFSLGLRNVIICGFLGNARAGKFPFTKGIFIETVRDYNNFWQGARQNYFSRAYGENSFLSSVHKSYSTLLEKDISGNILEDIGLK